ncbi:hypothetical protein ABEB36_015012 [Hypothenemus hampei]|uniref:Ionotropic glutamate receptor C-terminal domain-containing protein n=1 Tax=Hypothenemus hampei TaxID=57062 RepID=A0ABD1E1U3_HYPHA
MAIISDSIYMDIFQKQWFRRFENFLSYILIFVKDSDDLLAPSNDIQMSLGIAKMNGCQMYIILISNGLQVGRLLKFGDRYRVLNTRYNYIIMFDNRLFEKKLLYLWKRIINVVFIKKYSGRKTEKNNSKSDWFELTTVPFPINFEDVLIPKRLDIWTKSKFRKGYFVLFWKLLKKISCLNLKRIRLFFVLNAIRNCIFLCKIINLIFSASDLFKDKTYDLKNQTLNIATFSHIPGTVKSSDSTFKQHVRANIKTANNFSFSGTEIEILDTISKVMNFQCGLYEPENADIELWGRKGIGFYTGLLGEMTRAKADLALGDLYYIPYILNIMDLSIPYNTECLTFLTPEALTDISWKTLILPFDSVMWGGVIGCLLVTSAVFYCLAKFHLFKAKIRKLEKKTKGNAEERRKRLLKLSIYSQIIKMDYDIKYSLLKEQYKHCKEDHEPKGLYQFSDPKNSILYNFSMLLLVSLPKLPTGWSLRVFTGWYWLYCLLVVVAYRASLTAILSRPTPRVTIDSLQELIDSKLTYGGWGEISMEFFKSSNDEFINRIKGDFEVVNNSDNAVSRVADGSFAFYENTYFLKEAIFKQNNILTGKNMTNNTEKISTPKEINRNLHIMKDCIINMPVSIGLQKNSVLEAGLIEKWLNDVMQKILTYKSTQNDIGQKALMDLKKLYGALVILAIGYFLGTLTLIAELIYYDHKVSKHPGYNKYSRIVYNIKKAK